VSTASVTNKPSHGNTRLEGCRLLGVVLRLAALGRGDNAKGAGRRLVGSGSMRLLLWQVLKVSLIRVLEAVAAAVVVAKVSQVGEEEAPLRLQEAVAWLSERRVALVDGLVLCVLTACRTVAKTGACSRCED
jgi:hypothetical protein